MTNAKREAARKALAAYYSGSIAASVSTSLAKGETNHSASERQAAREVADQYRRGNVQ